MASSAAADSSGLTKHGFPRGYRFVPDNLEVFDLLRDRIRGRPLPPPVAAVFHDLRILDHHPQDLYEAYKEYEENGCIYFFSRREFPPPGASGVRPEKERRPVRTANGGGWKPSGGGKHLTRLRSYDCAGKMVTMVFYERVPHEHEPLKTDWGMHEFTVPVSPNKFSDLAVYRLYKVGGNKEGKKAAAARRRKERANNSSDHHVGAVSGDGEAFESSLVVPPPGQPSAAGTFVTSNQAAASTSQMQQHTGIFGQAQHYHHHQYSFTAAPPTPGPCIWAPSAAVNPPAHGAGLPGYSQFSGTPAPAPAPPAAANPAAQQTPGDVGATRSPPATPAAEEHAAATASPQHVQVAGCDKPMEAVDPPPLEVAPPPAPEQAPAGQDECMPMDDDVWGEILGLSIDTGLGSTDDLFTFDNTYFSMEELVGPMFATPPPTPTPMEEDDPSGGDENCKGGGKPQEPPAALGLTA